MHNIAQIVHRRQKRRLIAGRNPAGKSGLGCSLLLSLMGAVTSLILVFAYLQVARDLPSVETIPQYLSPPNGLYLQPTRIYDRSGQNLLLELENVAGSRKYLPLVDPTGEQLPATLVIATIAWIDPTFWSNPGYSLEGLIQDRPATPAQRLVSDLLLWQEAPGLRRGLRERILAVQLTARFGRNQVLEWYLNSARFGHLLYGAEAASQAYFGKPAYRLNLAEASVLAAVAEDPSVNPVDEPRKSLERGAQVIQALYDQELIDAVAAAQAGKTAVEIKSLEQTRSDSAPAFIELALSQLSTLIDIDRVERGGIRVLTTLDYGLQQQVSCATQIHLAYLEGDQAESAGSHQSYEDCPAARLLPKLTSGPTSPTHGVVAEVVVLDPANGQVLALVEGAPFLSSEKGHTPSLNLLHQTGTLATPIIYLAGLTRGYSPSSLLWDIPPGVSMEFGSSSPAQQFHGPVRLRTALANDYLPPALDLFNQVGAENVWRTANQLGLRSFDPARLAPVLEPGQAFLEQASASLLEIVQAYGVFANQGVLAGQSLERPTQGPRQTDILPASLLRVEELSGQIWLDWSLAQSRPAASPQLAYLVNHILGDEPARWPSLGHPNPLEIDRPAGVKIGQISTHSAGWTVGYTPQLAAGVWLGRDTDAAATPDLPKQAASLWHAVIRYASQDLPAQAWTTPPGIKTIEVCDPSGMLPTADCPKTVLEVFLEGNEPLHIDPLYRSFQVNRDTGNLATIFTPPELVDSRVYLVAPPLAAGWARQADLPLPPQTYDSIYIPIPSSQVQITSPAMFSHIKGKVNIYGNAGENEILFFRLQVGRGLYPTHWVQIGQDKLTSPKDELLGEWDTQGFSGLYALQLQVVYQDRRIEKHIIQVTVDNELPHISILSPEESQHFVLKDEADVILNVQASDNFQLFKVDFFVDQRPVASVNHPPFIASWKASAGDHMLRARAVDLAGNASEARLEFSVGK